MTLMTKSKEVPAPTGAGPREARMPETGLRLNLGCGPNAPDGWVNVDGSWNAWFSHHPHLLHAVRFLRIVPAERGAVWTARPVVHDIRRPLPFRSNTFVAIYASHVLEHLHFDDAQRLLHECLRVLVPGGVLRIVVPDLESIALQYLKKKSAGDPTAAETMNEMLAFRSRNAPTGNLIMRFYNSVKDFHAHKWMYDASSLKDYVQRVGFNDVRQREYLESEIRGISEVERAERVVDGAGVCIEARKA